MNTAVKDMITVRDGAITGTDYDYQILVDNTYTAGKLSNGTTITEANIKVMLNELKVVFPAGTSWGDSTNGGDRYPCNANGISRFFDNSPSLCSAYGSTVFSFCLKQKVLRLPHV